jgi:hypothetical protein
VGWFVPSTNLFYSLYLWDQPPSVGTNDDIWIMITDQNNDPGAELPYPMTS